MNSNVYELQNCALGIFVADARAFDLQLLVDDFGFKSIKLSLNKSVGFYALIVTGILTFVDDLFERDTFLVFKALLVLQKSLVERLQESDQACAVIRV